MKAILFDFDGVLTLDATGTVSIANYISKTTGIDRVLFETEYRKYNNDLLYGRLKHEDIWDKLCCGIKRNIDISVLHDSFINTPMDKEILELVKILKINGYKTGMVI